MCRRKQLCLVETSGIKCPNVSYLVTCVFKSSISPVRSQDLKMMCAESEQTRKCWTSAFRLFKVFKNDPLSKCLLIIMYIHIDKVKTVCVCLCICQYGKQLQCNYQLSKSTPSSLEGRRLTEVRRSPRMRKKNPRRHLF